jgi:hypothetical protein
VLENALTALVGEQFVELKDLVGKHILTGVSTDKVPMQTHDFGDYESVEDCESISFALDGLVYTAIQDPSDGYRSSMRSIYICGSILNVFPATEVDCSMRENGEYEINEVLDVVDVLSGKIILSVGTGNTNDYYPYWVAVWDPTGLYLNREIEF